jgi:hypothetical protein
MEIRGIYEKLSYSCSAGLAPECNAPNIVLTHMINKESTFLISLIRLCCIKIPYAAGDEPASENVRKLGIKKLWISAELIASDKPKRYRMTCVSLST